MHVFIRTSPFRPNDPQYTASVTVPLPCPTADTLQLVAAALAGLERLYKPDYPYAKAGVMLLDLQSDAITQGTLDLDDGVGYGAQRSQLMHTMDAINNRYGRGALKIASSRIVRDSAHRQDWEMRQERRSPRYTTHWDEMLVVHA